MPTPRRTFLTYLLMAALLFQGLSGIAGGSALLADPTGALIHLPAAWLEGSPFQDYLIPGVILLVVLGVVPLIVLYGLWKRRAWGGPAALLVGLALVVWIAVEILVIGYHAQPPLQFIYGLVGLAILALAVPPTVQAYKAHQHHVHV